MSQLNVNKIKNRAGNSGPTLDGNTTITGILSATSFSGDGSGLSNVIGIAQTANINTDTLVVSGVTTATNEIKVRSDDGTPGNIDLYCEVNDAHYVRVQAPPHAEYSGNVTAILPTQSGDILVGDTSSAITQNLNTSGIITASSGFVGNLSGNLTGDVTGNLTGDVTGNLTGDVTGNVTGTTASFTGDVSIGGTLTYEDVTNVDSVGMVTARNGIEVTGIVTARPGTAVTFYGDFVGADGSPVGGGGGGTSAVSRDNDGANGRLDTFGTGQFTVFTSPGTFDATGIASVRARVVGAGSKGCEVVNYHTYCVKGYLYAPFGPYRCCIYQSVCCVSGIGGGAGGGYAHKTIESSDYPGPSAFNIAVGQPWNCTCTPTVGNSCFGPGVVATGGIGTVGGSGSGGDFNATGGGPSVKVAGGAAGSQLGPGDSETCLVCTPLTPATGIKGACGTCGSISGVVREFPPGYSDSCIRQSIDNGWDWGQRTHWGTERFPFDIFTGHIGYAQRITPGSCRCEFIKPGCSGGGGASMTFTCAGCWCEVPCCVCSGYGGGCTLCWNCGPARMGGEIIYVSNVNNCQSITPGCAGHGAGGSAGALTMRAPCNCYNIQSGGKGGYGGGGGATISFCCKNPTCSPCNVYCPGTTGPNSQTACGGDGGPGIVIVEW